jgi:hypothetical protein
VAACRRTGVRPAGLRRIEIEPVEVFRPMPCGVGVDKCRETPYFSAHKSLLASSARGFLGAQQPISGVRKERSDLAQTTSFASGYAS